MQSNIINRCGAFLDECDIFFNGIEGDFILPNSLNLDDLVAQSTLLFNRLGGMILLKQVSDIISLGGMEYES